MLEEDGMKCVTVAESFEERTILDSPSKEIYLDRMNKKLQDIGKEITQKVKPKAVVVFSAHWQAGANEIEVNTAEMNPLIYEYGFFLKPPRHASMRSLTFSR